MLWWVFGDGKRSVSDLPLHERCAHLLLPLSLCLCPSCPVRNQHRSAERVLALTAKAVRAGTTVGTGHLFSANSARQTFCSNGWLFRFLSASEPPKIPYRLGGRRPATEELDYFFWRETLAAGASTAGPLQKKHRDVTQAKKLVATMAKGYVWDYLKCYNTEYLHIYQ